MPDSDRPPSGEEKESPGERTEIKHEASSDSGSSRAKVRFTPGTMLADRYRIVALLGRGGMGEVYRADDTKLGQQVALKFLPREFARDGNKLRRLYEEVRLGRQVSHPNVCRMYDISEWEGHHFISMEYIDGEDLASLLRRIGQLPEGKALDLARDLCAGLAAAHALGIVHRDLKPANIMIDGRGDARLTDFGLAALAEDLENRREVAGTPAYMAPEQLEGREVSQRTDLYALGLILYEMFTGKRLFEGATFGDILSQHKSSSSQSLSRDTGDLDPAIQRVIVRCLEEDPAKRPASIHSVIAALPGGDPLQAALDAGETPSPEMVAAAGSVGELTPAVAWPLLILAVVVILGTAAISPRVRLYGQIEQPLKPIELAVRARAILADTGLTERPADTVWEMGVDSDYRLWRRELNQSDAATEAEGVEQTFSPLLFGYRESPQPMTSEGEDRVSAFGSIPPLVVAGMGQILLEPDGRLRRFVLVPPEEETTTGGTSVDWTPLFSAAGLDIADARETDPRWRPPIGTDERFAWLISVENLADPIRVEAASLSGHRAWFEVVAPWKRPAEPFGTRRSRSAQIGDLIFMLFVLGAVVAGLVLCHRNLRRGRGDRQGAFRIALVVVVLSLVSGSLRSDHYWSATLEVGGFFRILAFSCFAGLLMWVWYVALEPYLRRRWPRTLIAWSRLLQRKWLDPLVGQSILIGVLVGSSVRLLHWMSLAAPSWLGWTPPVPFDTIFLELTAWRFNLSYLINSVMDGIVSGVIWMVFLLITNLVLRRRGLAIAAVFILMALTMGFENYPWLEWPARIITAGALTWLMVRHGLLALAAATFAISMFSAFPMTFDPSTIYFGRGLLGMIVVIGVAIFGFAQSLGSHAMFGEPVLED